VSVLHVKFLSCVFLLILINVPLVLLQYPPSTKTTSSLLQFLRLYRAHNGATFTALVLTVLTIFISFSSVIDPCLEPVVVNGSSVLQDSGLCGEHGTCESLSAGNYQCRCDIDYTGNHCHKSKCVVLLTER